MDARLEGIQNGVGEQKFRASGCRRHSVCLEVKEIKEMG